MTPLVLFALSLTLADTPTPPPADVNEGCLACHADPAMSTTLPDGTVLSLHVDPATFAGSVHGSKLSCLDCHAGMDEVPHPPQPFSTRRQVSLAYYEQCKRCHYSTFSKTLDSAHQAALARGDVTAPLCMDCHGAHDTVTPGYPRGRISRTCAKCHEAVSRTYEQSVHGQALLVEHNPDVPVCSDCHRSHDVAGPHASRWQASTPDLCASCHADAQLMQKYGLSTLVHRTYLADFHGATASLRSRAEPRNAPVVARCTDCHGVHDITKVDAPDSPVLKANLVATCRRCHPDATTNFPDAWLSHYEPSWSRTPLVKGVTVAYQFLIPFMIGGLVLQVGLHLWRVVVNR